MLVSNGVSEMNKLRERTICSKTSNISTVWDHMIEQVLLWYTHSLQVLYRHVVTCAYWRIPMVVETPMKMQCTSHKTINYVPHSVSHVVLANVILSFMTRRQCCGLTPQHGLGAWEANMMATENPPLIDDFPIYMLTVEGICHSHV